MNEFLNKRYIRNGRHSSWNTVLKVDVLSLVFYDADIAVLGVLVMDDIVVVPLRFDRIMMEFVRLTGKNQITRKKDKYTQDN